MFMVHALDGALALQADGAVIIR
jgi:hypothetical protein